MASNSVTGLNGDKLVSCNVVPDPINTVSEEALLATIRSMFSVMYGTILKMMFVDHISLFFCGVVLYTMVSISNSMPSMSRLGWLVIGGRRRHRFRPRSK